MTLRMTQRLRSSFSVFSSGCSEGPDKSVIVYVNTEVSKTDTVWVGVGSTATWFHSFCVVCDRVVKRNDLVPESIL